MAERGGKDPSPRAAALADLYRHAALLASSGDLAAASAMHETIGRLLRSAGPGDNAKVIDLGDERARRGS